MKSVDDTTRERREWVIGIWLLVIAVMVFAMVILGGLTRLTDSGLSIVEWRPVTGWLPPLTHAEWEEAFAAYRAFPEYQKVNAGMTLAEFEKIFWLEYLHRLWGRLIGLVFAIPFAVFVVRGWVTPSLAFKLAGLFLLGGLQGLLGWYMVQSGLVDRPDVSQYRLVAHLCLALVIIAIAILLALSLLVPKPVVNSSRGIAATAIGVAALVFITIVAGGFVAGLNAGYAYNTFPLMDGELVPKLAFAFDPAWRAPFEDPTTTQFVHRVLAAITVVAVLGLRAALLTVQVTAVARAVANLLCVCVLAQFALGVITLLTFVALPAAMLHQMNAMILWILALICAWTTFPRKHSSAAYTAPRKVFPPAAGPMATSS